MPFLRLVLKNALRNRRRTILTAISVAVSLFLLTSLRTFVDELQGDSLMSEQSGRRLIARSSVSLQLPLPLAYKSRLARMDGADIVSEYQWIPCYYKEPHEPMVVVAVDPRFIGSDPEYHVSARDVAAFHADRAGALVPEKMMQRFGWRVGERIRFVGTIFPYDLDLTIRGTYTGPMQNIPFCHFSYFNEATRRTLPSRADKSMAFVILARSAADAARLSAAIDREFENADAPTRTESEKNFVLGFTSMLGNVKLFISAIAAAVIFAIVLVTTNTMSMAVRERTHEIAVLKTLGFRPRQVLLLIVGESVLISAAGGAFGIAAAEGIFRWFDIYQLTNGIVQHFDISRSTLIAGIALALAMGIVSSAIPAWRGAMRPIAASLREV